jgi:phage FluMu protein Com
MNIKVNKQAKYNILMQCPRCYQIEKQKSKIKNLKTGHSTEKQKSNKKYEIKMIEFVDYLGDFTETQRLHRRERERCSPER